MQWVDFSPLENTRYLFNNKDWKFDYFSKHVCF